MKMNIFVTDVFTIISRDLRLGLVVVANFECRHLINVSLLTNKSYRVIMFNIMES
jgi:hypothetical protein